MSNNYGDVAINLPADWSRRRMAGDQKFILSTVGHEGGVPDAYLKENIEKRHQFRWVAPSDSDMISVLRTQKYDWVTKQTWEKNPELWEWDGEEYLIHNGQRLMARAAEYYFADQEAMDRTQKERDQKRSISAEEERAMRKIEAHGAIVEDERGRPLKPLSQNPSR